MRPGEIDVPLEIAERERARRGEHRLAAVQPGSRERATDPQPCGAAIDEDDVVEQVDRLEAQHERRIAVLLEDHRRRRAPPRGNAPCRAGRRRGSCAASRRLARCCREGRSASRCTARRRAQPRDEPALAGGERQRRRRARSVRGSGSRFEVGNEFRRRPLVAGVDLHEAALGIDDGGPQVVGDLDRAGSPGST